MKPPAKEGIQQGDLFARPKPPTDSERQAQPQPQPQAAPPAAPAAKPQPRVYTVTQVVRAASRAIEAGLAAVWIEGELFGVKRHTSGHLYFSLKDDEAQLPVVMWRADAQRVKFEVEDGMHVRVRGRLTIYEAHGKFQMYATALEPVGAGEQAIQFEQLKKKLEAEGLFASARKRPLPFWPRRVGVVTSPTGAAVKDIIRVLHRRAPIPILISPAAVQGDGAAFEICRALERICRVPDVDVVILGRGGGSAEDLVAFNDERVARAIAACSKPVISAVGHEHDVTIADFVADERAPTPSAAAERAVPVAAEVAEGLTALSRRLSRAMQREREQRAIALERLAARLGDPARWVERARQRLDDLAERANRAASALLRGRRAGLQTLDHRLASLHPRTRLAEDRGRLARLSPRLDAAIARAQARARSELSHLMSSLDSLSPLRVLERGYGLVRGPDKSLVTDAASVKEGDEISVELRRGSLDARVLRTRSSNGSGESL